MELEQLELTQRAIAGDREALSTLWRTHRVWVAAVIAAHRPGQGELEDLLQEVAMAVVRNIHLLEDAARFPAWLRAIAVNTLRTTWRARAVRAHTANGSVAVTTGIHGIAARNGSTAASTDRAEALLQRIATLPLIYRETLLLHGVRGLNTRHIAAVIDVPVKTVETRLIRARQMLLAESDISVHAYEPCVEDRSS